MTANERDDVLAPAQGAAPVANARKSGAVPVEVLLAAEARIRRQQRPRAGWGLSLPFIMLVVPVLAAGLVVAHFGSSRAAQIESATKSVQQQEVVLARRVEQTRTYRVELQQLGQDLAGHRTTLDAAVGKLRQSQAYDATGMARALRQRLPNRSEEECVAVTLIEAALREVRDPVANEDLSTRLQKEFRDTYHTASPRFGWKGLETTAAAPRGY